jgi:hypothetical protein
MPRVGRIRRAAPGAPRPDQVLEFAARFIADFGVPVVAAPRAIGESRPGRATPFDK